MSTDLGKRTLGRRTLLGAAALAPFAVQAGGLSRAYAAGDPQQVGAWTAPFPLGGMAIHATLLRNDDVLIFQYIEGQLGHDHTSWVGTWNWRTNVTQEAPFTYHRDVFCAAQNVLADGRLYVAGGHDHNTGKRQDPFGTSATDLYDPIARTWTPAPSMAQVRWYPTSVGLPNGKTLIFGGQAGPNVPSNTVEEYDANTGVMRTLPDSATMKQGVYPRLHLMANGKVLRSGPQRKAWYFDPATSIWTGLSGMLYGGRQRGIVALLPGAHRVLTCGGGDSGSPTATAEILDTTMTTPKWRYTAPLAHARMLANSVVLPDGKVLVIGGGAAFKYTNPVLVPELFDPTTETWSDMAPQQASRMYHSTAALLPDGRVLSAGQDDGPYAKHGEIYSPPYLFRGPRPTISGAPQSIARGGQLQFNSPEAADITRVVLIRPSSTTHGIDTDQRSIPIAFSTSGTTVTAQVPSSGFATPPGYYLLFALNSLGVPAVAPWIQVS